MLEEILKKKRGFFLFSQFVNSDSLCGYRLNHSCVLLRVYYFVTEEEDSTVRLILNLDNSKVYGRKYISKISQ